MPEGDIATLGLRVDSRDVARGADRLGDLETQGARAEVQANKLGRTVRRVGAILATGWVTRAVIQNTVRAQESAAQLEARIRSTGGAAGRSTQQLQEYADALQAVTTFGDEAIESAQGILLTFTGVRDEAFDRTTSAVLDLAVAFGTDLKSAAIQLGKALNDPATQLTALSRSGITFSLAQQEVIRDLARTNRLAEAQSLILDELETQFGGAAVAARDNLGGALANLKNVIGDAFEISRQDSQGLIDFIDRVAANVPQVTRHFQLLTDVVVSLGIAAGITGAAAAFAILGPAISISVTAIISAVAAAESLAAVLAVLNLALGPTGWFVVGVTAVAAAIFTWRRATREQTDEIWDLNAALEAQRTALLTLTEAEIEAEIAALQRRAAQLAVQKEEAKALNELAQAAGFLGTGETTDINRQLTETGLLIIELEEALQRMQDAAERDGLARLTAEQKKALEVSRETVAALKIQADEQERLFEASRRGAEFTREVNDEIRREQALRAALEKSTAEHRAEVEALVNEYFDLLEATEANERAAEEAARNEEERVRRQRERIAEAVREEQEALRLERERITELRESIRLNESLARASIQVAEAFEVITAEASKYLQSLVQIKAAIEFLNAGGPGALQGALPGLIGGVVTIAAGVFGGDDERERERLRLAEERNRILEENQAALQGIRENLGAPDPVTAELLADLQTTIDGIVRFRTQIQGNQSPFGPSVFDAFTELDLPLSFEEFVEAAALLGINVENLTRQQLTDLIDAIQLTGQTIEQLQAKFDESLELRLLEAQGREQEAATLRLTLRHEQELEDARRQNLETTLLETVQAEERLALERRASARAAEEAARAERELAATIEGLVVRALELTGRGGLAGEARLRFRQANESANLGDVPPEVRALLNTIHALERIEFEAGQAIAEIEADTARQVAIMDERIEIARDQLDVARDQLQEQERTVEATRRVIERLEDFSSGLLLGGQSALSPVSQLAEARRQFDAVASAALGGDAAAAESLPDAARALLDASRAVNASGPGFASDFADVLRTTDAVTAQFRDQLTTEERILAELQAQTEGLEEQISALEAQRAEIEAAAAAQIEEIKAQAANDSFWYNRIIERLLKILDQAVESHEQFEHINSGIELIAADQKNFATEGFALYDGPLLDLTHRLVALEQRNGEEIISELKGSRRENEAAVRLLSAGFRGTITRLHNVEGRLEAQRVEFRRGLEAIALS